MSGLEARIADVLHEHTLHMLIMASGDANGEWVVECNCDITPISADGFFDGEKKFAAHQAAMLAPVIAEAQAEALREAADDQALRLSGHSGISITRLRTRADKLEAS